MIDLLIASGESHLLASAIAQVPTACNRRPLSYATAVRGENAGRLLADFATTRQRYEPHIAFVADHLGSSKVVDLERLATALYITRESAGDKGIEARAARLNELKPHIPIELARRAVDDLQVGPTLSHPVLCVNAS
ncbi:MAG: hypothetical protein ACLQGP_32375 [Isosphaeraceae bacterium]